MRKLSQIDESLLGNIQKKVMNDEVRKEDDVNNLNLEELFDYVSKRYEYRNKHYGFVSLGRDFIVSLLEGDGDIVYAKIRFDDTRNHVTAITTNGKVFKDDMNILYDNFNAEKPYTYATYCWSISSKTGEVSNNLFIQLIDKFIELSPNSLLKKI